MNPADLIRAIRNPDQAVLFTFNSQPGNPISGHVVTLVSYDPENGFGFLNAGALSQLPGITYFSKAQMEGFINDPIWQNQPNFVVITRP
jgi:hypothetical protein